MACESDLSVVSYTAVHADGRLLDDKGRILNHPALAQPLRLYDGAIYAGTTANWQDWFDMSRPHEAVINNTYSVCDIDTLDDLQKHIKFI